MEEWMGKGKSAGRLDSESESAPQLGYRCESARARESERERESERARARARALL